MKTTLLALLATAPVLACGPRFYQAAPPLAPAEMSFAVRTLADLHDRSTAKHWTREELLQQSAALTSEALTLLQHPGRDFAAGMEALRQRNLAGAYSANTSNFLFELRDLHDAGIPAAEAHAYATWRSGMVSPDAGLATEQPRNLPGAGAPLLQRVQARGERRRRMAALTAAAPPDLRPFYEVQHAAAAFRAHDFAEARERFENVVHFHPQHPRAETAAFMAMRCRIEIARDAARVKRERDLPEIQAALGSLNHFSNHWPQGRFAAELSGWYGALHFIRGDYGAAFCSYAEQAETKDHPEIVRQALHEAERCLLKLSEPGADAGQLLHATSILPAYPRAAMRVVYFLLEPAATVNYAQWPWNSEHHELSGGAAAPDRLARRWRIRAEGRGVLQELARVCEQAKPEDRTGEWDPFALAVVVWQATEDGDHRRALSLCRRHAALVDQSDDLQTVRAIALQRDGRAEEAIAAWRVLTAQFPKSPLAAQARQRLVALLSDAHRPAEALVMILEDEARQQAAITEARASGQAVVFPAPDGDGPGLLEDDLRQWRDVLELMAPVSDLEKEWQRAAQPAVQEMLAALLTARWLSEGRADKVQPYMQEPDPPPPLDANPDWAVIKPQPLPRHVAAWRQTFQPLATQMKKAAAQRGRAGAVTWLKAGHAWAALRRDFILCRPAGVYMRSEFREAEQRVQRNAVALGWPQAKVTAALLRGDFLAPAADCWEQAVTAAPESAEAAEALFLLNESLRQRAEFTPFAMRAAQDLDWSAQSAEYVRKLAAHRRRGVWQERAVAWDFTDAHWLPGNDVPHLLDVTVAGVLGDFSPTTTMEPVPLADATDYAETRRLAATVPVGPQRQHGIAALWRQWLAEHPQSERREAGMFQLTRAVCRAARGWTRFVNAPWPEGPLSGSHYTIIATDRDDPPGTAAEAAQALADFDKAWPASRFAADLQFFKGSIAIERGDFAAAFAHLVPLLNDSTHPELHMDAALHLTDVFLRLLDPVQRPAILAALRHDAAAREKLRRFMASATPGGRLAPFGKAAGL